MKGPRLGPGEENITWPNQVAPRGRRTSSTRNVKPQTSNLNARGGSPAATDQSQLPRPDGGGSGRNRPGALLDTPGGGGGWDGGGTGPGTPLLERPQWRDPRRGWRVSIRPQPTRAPEGKATTLGPLRGRGPAWAVVPRPKLQWGIGGTTGGAAAAALRLTLAPRVAGTAIRDPPPPPPHEGQQGPREPGGDTCCLPREQGKWGTQPPPPPAQIPGP